MKLIVKRYNQDPEIIGVFDWKNIKSDRIEYIQLCNTDDLDAGPRAFTRNGLIFFIMKAQASLEVNRHLYGIGESDDGTSVRIRWYDENCHGQEVERRSIEECHSGLKLVH